MAECILVKQFLNKLNAEERGVEQLPDTLRHGDRGERLRRAEQVHLAPLQRSGVLGGRRDVDDLDQAEGVQSRVVL